MSGAAGVDVNRKTFYHLSLSLPYLFLLLSGGLVFLLDGFRFTRSLAGDSPSVFLGMLYFFVVTAVIWGPLYTWMVIVFLLWSRKRSASQVRQLYLLSPIVLACSMGLPVLIVDLPSSAMLLLVGFLGMNHMGYVASQLPIGSYRGEAGIGIAGAWFFMAIICVLVGYAFVGLILWLEKSFEKRHLFKEEGAIPAL